MSKKQLQLGMNPSTASHRLVKDLLWDRIASEEYCYYCDKRMSRDTFSIEHKIPWLDSENPVELFFDLNNIAFSHRSCNVGARRQTRTKRTPAEHRAADAERKRKSYTTEGRRDKYLRTGH